MRAVREPGVVRNNDRHEVLPYSNLRRKTQRATMLQNAEGFTHALSPKLIAEHLYDYLENPIPAAFPRFRLPPFPNAQTNLPSHTADILNDHQTVFAQRNVAVQPDLTAETTTRTAPTTFRGADVSKETNPLVEDVVASCVERPRFNFDVYFTRMRIIEPDLSSSVAWARYERELQVYEMELALAIQRETTCTEREKKEVVRQTAKQARNAGKRCQ